MTTATFTAQVGTPTFTPPAGTITNKTPVSISTVTPNAVIFWTTNGTTPTTSSKIYTKPLILSAGLTVNAIGIATNYANSVMGSATYTQTEVAMPTFSPANGPITNKTKISIAITTPKAVIHFTTNGKNPTAGSAVYSRPLTLNGGVTLKAIGIARGYSNSVVASVTYAAAQTARCRFSPRRAGRSPTGRRWSYPARRRGARFTTPPMAAFPRPGRRCIPGQLSSMRAKSSVPLLWPKIMRTAA